MSSLRLFAVPVCALLLSTACGRTEAVFVATGNDTGADTWSYEDTATPEDIPGSTTISDEATGTDDWMTGEWGEDDPETWGEDVTDEETLDTFDTTDFDTDIDTTVDTTVDTDTDTNTTDTNTDTTDTNTDTTDTNTDTTDTNTDTATDTNTDTATDTNTDTATTDTTDTATTDTGGETCADAAQCLVDCGSFSGMCINDCTADLPDDQANLLFDLQICAIQACFFQGQCQLGDFNAPECIQCRLDANVDPESVGCGPEGMACGV